MNWIASLILAASVFVPIVLAIAYVSPSLALAGFLIVPVVKGNLWYLFPGFYGWVGYLFDVFMVINSLLSLYVLYRKNGLPFRSRASRGFVVLWVMFCVCVLVGFLHTRDSVTGTQRVLMFVVFNSLTVLVGVMCGSSVASLEAVTRAIVLGGIATAVLTLVVGAPSAEYEGARLAIGYGSVLQSADLMADAMLAILVLWIAGVRWKGYWLVFVMIPLILFAELVSGARGAIVGAAIGAIYVLVVYRRQPGIGKVVGLVILVVAIWCTGSLFMKRAEAGRFSGMEVRKGLQDRIELAKFTIMEWTKSPILGRGTGDFSYQFKGRVGEKSYPHNIYLEVLNELGLVGFLIYMGLMIPGLRFVFAGLQSKYSDLPYFASIVIVGVCLGYHLLMGLKMSTYASSPMLYFFLGMSMGISGMIREQQVYAEPAWDTTVLRMP